MSWILFVTICTFVVLFLHGQDFAHSNMINCLHVCLWIYIFPFLFYIVYYGFLLIYHNMALYKILDHKCPTFCCIFLCQLCIEIHIWVIFSRTGKRSIIGHVFQKFSSFLRGHFSTFFSSIFQLILKIQMRLLSQFAGFFFFLTISKCSLNLAIFPKNNSKWEFLMQNAADTKP